ncbi:hypothetical protein NX059_004684 [Plenodomus lindquistii]|nr:hypothetical protein NX059_004684 [Plenodomus lindquistii]
MSDHKVEPEVTNAFVDLSGISTSAFSNPYDALISACENDTVQIQSKYHLHRITRNAQQKEKLLAPSFPGVSIDPILQKLSNPLLEPSYKDPRHCLVFWGRPTQKVKEMIHRVQQELLKVAPNLWIMPPDCLHITVLEVTHSKTAEEIQQLVEHIKSSAPAITDYSYNHRARLIKPLIGYDASALALSFVPAAGEGVHGGRTATNDEYTYHHLRRDIFNLCRNAGIQVDSRYVVPSSHLTVGRFIDPKDFADESGKPDAQKMAAFVAKIEEINSWLEKEFWPEQNGGMISTGGEFNVGEDKGLDCRMGTLWYGGGESVHTGKGY